jgi:hypothetical protein
MGIPKSFHEGRLGVARFLRVTLRALGRHNQLGRQPYLAIFRAVLECSNQHPIIGGKPLLAIRVLLAWLELDLRGKRQDHQRVRGVVGIGEHLASETRLAVSSCCFI